MRKYTPPPNVYELLKTLSLEEKEELLKYLQKSVEEEKYGPPLSITWKQNGKESRGICTCFRLSPISMTRLNFWMSGTAVNFWPRIPEPKPCQRRFAAGF